MDHRQHSNVVQGLWGSVSRIVNRQRAALYQPMLLDLGFFFVIGMVLGALGERLLEVLYALGATVIRSSASAVQTQDLYSTLSPQAQSLGGQGLFLLVTMILSVYALYICFHGMMWTLVRSWIGPVDKRVYLKRFAQVNILWGIGALVLLVWAIAIELMSRIGEILQEWPWWVAASILIYLASISYEVIGKYPAIKSLAYTCRLALRPKLLVSAMCIGLVLFALDALMRSLGSSAVALVCGAIVVFGVIALLRLIFCIIVEECHAR